MAGLAPASASAARNVATARGSAGSGSTDRASHQAKKIRQSDGTWEIDLGMYVPGTYSYTLKDRRTNTPIKGSFIVTK